MGRRNVLTDRECGSGWPWTGRSTLGRHAQRAAWGAVAAGGVAHAGPALSAAAPLRRLLMPGLCGVGRPDGFGLTFDDGPDPRGTPAVLDQLDRLGWRATFFVLGSQVALHPDILRETVAAGHEIAVHGYSHGNHLRRGPVEIAEDLHRSVELISDTAGERPRWFRPPYGVFSAGTVHACRQQRLRPMLWSTWGRDWTRTTPERITARVAAHLRPGGTVLLHDSDCTSTPDSWRATAKSLPLLAEAAARLDLTARPLREHLAVQ